MDLTPRSAHRVPAGSRRSRGRDRGAAAASPIAMRPPTVLPDYLAPDLRAVFAGTAAGERSAALGHYYAGRDNEFWSLLHKSGLTPGVPGPPPIARGGWRSMRGFAPCGIGDHRHLDGPRRPSPHRGDVGSASRGHRSRDAEGAHRRHSVTSATRPLASSREDRNVGVGRPGAFRVRAGAAVRRSTPRTRRAASTPPRSRPLSTPRSGRSPSCACCQPLRPYREVLSLIAPRATAPRSTRIGRPTRLSWQATQSSTSWQVVARAGHGPGQSALANRRKTENDRAALGPRSGPRATTTRHG